MTAPTSNTPPLLRVVLHEPEIPNNTGNIGRTCIATGAALHLVHPLAFETSARALRRAGLDYWPRLAPTEHPSWADAARTIPITGNNAWFFTTRATTPHWSARFAPGDALVFGKETAGLPDHILHAHPTRLLRFPMIPGERSLNLATAVCAAIYEALRQLHEQGHVAITDNAELIR